MIKNFKKLNLNIFSKNSLNNYNKLSSFNFNLNITKDQKDLSIFIIFNYSSEQIKFKGEIFTKIL